VVLVLVMLVVVVVLIVVVLVILKVVLKRRVELGEAAGYVVERENVLYY